MQRNSGMTRVGAEFHKVRKLRILEKDSRYPNSFRSGKVRILEGAKLRNFVEARIGRIPKKPRNCVKNKVRERSGRHGGSFERSSAESSGFAH
jgi:hypothetical protein